MPLPESLYRLAVGALRKLSPLFSRGESKLARGVRARRTASGALARWGREERDPSRPVVWFHAPSVGEGFQARAVAESLRRERPDIQVVYTYFSPSAVSFARGMPAEFKGYLPWDVPEEMAPVLDAVRPKMVVYTKTEVWPTLTEEAARREIPSVLVAATLPPGAGRSSLAGRWLLRSTFERLRGVAAVAEEDADGFARLGAEPRRIVVTGDPGIDSAADRLGEADPEAPHLALFRGRESERPTVVAGSTWGPDEEVLLPAVWRVRQSLPDVRLVLAPHEPTDARVAALTDALFLDGWSVARLSEVEERESVDGIDAVVVDRVGVLADLYTVGTMAYVGGGFHDEGLHSVLEPAAAGVPVLFGPRHQNARAARDLLEAGAAVEVASSPPLHDAALRWIHHPDEAREAGDRARSYIEGHRGAARRTAEVLERFLEPND